MYVILLFQIIQSNLHRYLRMILLYVSRFYHNFKCKFNNKNYIFSLLILSFTNIFNLLMRSFQIL